MNNTKIYKNAGIALKLGIIILAFGYIVNEIFFKKDLDKIYYFFIDILNKHNGVIFLYVFILMLFNWTLEIQKWRFLINRIEKVIFFKAIVGVFSGITVSTFTPNRIGEFAGRVFVLRTENRWQGVVLTIVGSISQLVTTICMGIASLLLFYPQFNFSDSFEFVLVFIAVLSFFLLLTFYFNVSVLLNLIIKIKWLEKIVKYVSVLKSINKKELIIVLLFSVLRHIIFSFQFYLLLKICGLGIDFQQSFILTSIIFFILAAIPTIALSDFGVRGSVSLFIFGLYYKGSQCNIDIINIGVISAAFFLWFINLAIPAIIGAFFVLKLKFFKP